MNKCKFDRILSARLAIRKEDAEVVASSEVKYIKDDEGWYHSKKEDGEINQVNNITRREDGIAVIHVDGALSFRSDLFTAWWGEDTYNSIEAAFDECLADESVKGIVFDINSPGGEVNGCADLADKIFNARGSKPYGIVARTGGMMCSAAYWLGSSCEKVYTASNGTLGSIGVLCAFTKIKESVLETTVVTSDLSPNKAPNPDDPEGLKIIKEELNSLAEVFIGAVARNRGVTAEDVKQNFGQGGVFIGDKAVAANLANGVMSLDDVCTEMKKQGMNSNGGAFMATNVKGAEGTKPEAVDLEAVKAQAVADYKNRVASIESVFAGLEISAEDKKQYIDGDKSVADATAFALTKAKEKIAAIAEDLKKVSAERDDFKAKAENKPAATSEKFRAVAALAASAAAQNSVQGGVAAESTNDKLLKDAYAAGAKAFK
ncbi:S49 family peptidase [uncultured Fibrobacter sp.]|uniref:S49 family peptidase n=1 Tax=uncultured Fibrobacter sp. TaxID=261512 RepID=UPI0025DFB45D|nr:S49 family peptidase [uncultured Fibrobacter sp.]